MINQRAHGALAARRAAVNADPLEVELGKTVCGRFEPGYAVRESSVMQVLPADIMKTFMSPVGPHAVDLHHDKTKLADLAVAGHQAERLRDKMILGAGIDFLDDGVFF